jgi:hypothetical protein
MHETNVAIQVLGTHRHGDDSPLPAPRTGSLTRQVRNERELLDEMETLLVRTT